MDETCADWNMKDKGNVDCADIQATYGSACGCPDAPEPKCNVCPNGDYVWKQFPRYNTFSDDFCVRMVYKMSKHTEYCAGNKRSVAKMCCSGTSPSGAKTPNDGINGKVDRKPKSSKNRENDKGGKEGQGGASNKLSKRLSSGDSTSNNKTSTGRNKTSKRASSGDPGARGSGQNSSYFKNKQTKRNTSRDFRSPSTARSPNARNNAGDDGVYTPNSNGNQGGGNYVYYYYGDDGDDYYH